ncbi:MAG: DUF2203 family protein [Bacillota bacterium]
MVQQQNNIGRYFTIEEAMKALSLIKSIGIEIIFYSNVVKEYAESGFTRIADHYQKKVRDLISEIEELGVIYRDWNGTQYLIEFPSVINNLEVSLSWKSDEEKIEYFHMPWRSYSGRERIPIDYLKLFYQDKQ